VGRACSTKGGDEEWWESQKERDHSEDQGVRGLTRLREMGWDGIGVALFVVVVVVCCSPTLHFHTCSCFHRRSLLPTAVVASMILATLQWKVLLGANGRFGGRQGTRLCSGRIRV
jgi:hypothetical protein